MDQRAAAGVIPIVIGRLTPAEGDLVREGELHGRLPVDDARRVLGDHRAGEPRGKRETEHAGRKRVTVGSTLLPW